MAGLPSKKTFLLNILLLAFAPLLSGQSVSPVLPKDGRVIEDQDLHFHWGTLDPYDHFQLQVADDAAFSSIVLDVEPIDSLDLDPASLSGGTYYWRVRRKYQGSYHAWSTVSSFRIFSPASYGKLAFWFRSDTGLDTTNGKISAWKDQSSNGVDLEQSTGTEQPVIDPPDPAINDHPTVKFDGNDDHLKGQTFSSQLVQGNSLFLVGRIKDDPATNYKWFDGNTSNTRNLFQAEGPKSSMLFAGKQLNFSHPAQDLRSYNFFSLEYDGTDSKVHINEKDSTQGDAGGFPLEALTVGAKKNGNDNFLNGHIAELLGYDTILAEKKRKTVAKYIRHKYAPPVNLGRDIKTACGPSTELTVPSRYDVIAWSTGATEDTLTIDSAGTYWVQAKGIFGHTSYDTIVVDSIIPPPDLNRPQDSGICPGDTYVWDPMLNDTALYDLSWNNGSTDTLLRIDTTGRYALTVSDTFGCIKNSDTLDVFLSHFEDSVSLGPDTSLCSGNTIELVKGGGAADTYLWSTGESTPSKTIDTAGTYWLEATDTVGCKGRDSIDVTVIGEAPDASFSWGIACNDNKVGFTNNASIPGGTSVASWKWDFDDGDSAFVADPSHLFPDSGTYKVTLEVALNTGCLDDTTRTVTVHPLPEPDFSYTQPCERSKIEFQDSSASPGSLVNHSWDFGDPNTDDDTLSGDTVQYTYSNDGFRTVRLAVTDSNGCTDSLLRSVNVLPSPDAAFKAPDVCSGTPVQFADSSSGKISDYYWDFGDGQFITNTDSPTYNYDDAKTYLPRLIVTAPNGCQDDTSKSLEVHPEPIPGFRNDPLCVDAPVTFTDTSSIAGGDSLTGLDWSIDGGPPDSGTQWTHRFESTGSVTITHSVRSNFGCEASVSKSFSVNEPPDVQLETDPSWGDPPLKARFTPVGTFDSAVWHFGDGTSSNTFEPTHTYTDSGVHQVRLTGINTHGCRDSAFRKVYVKDPRIDVRIPRLFVEEKNGFYQVTAVVDNLGPIRLEYLELEMKPQNAPALKEVWEGKLSPGDRDRYTFNGLVEKGNGIPTICVEAIDPNHIEDHAPWNDQACWTPDGELSILNLYPNPSSDRLNVEVRIPFDQTLRYKVTDARGRIVLDRKIENAQKGFLRIRPPIRKLDDGLYSMQIIGESNATQSKFLKSER